MHRYSDAWTKPSANHAMENSFRMRLCKKGDHDRKFQIAKTVPQGMALSWPWDTMRGTKTLKPQVCCRSKPDFSEDKEEAADLDAHPQLGSTFTCWLIDWLFHTRNQGPKATYAGVTSYFADLHTVSRSSQSKFAVPSQLCKQMKKINKNLTQILLRSGLDHLISGSDLAQLTPT